MKKIIPTFLVLSLIVLVILWQVNLKSTPQTSQSSSGLKDKNVPSKKSNDSVKHLGDDILQKNIVKLASKLDILISKDEVFKQLNNYRIDVKDLSLNIPKEKLIHYSKKLSLKLTKCIKKDFCGTTPDKEGYFDETSTPAHSLLARSLELLDLNLEGNETDLSEIPFNELIQIENTKVLKNTASLLLKSNPSDSELEDFLDLSQDLDGAKKQVFFTTLIINSSPNQRESVVSSLAAQFKSSDPYSIVAFFQKINDLSLTREELIKLASSGCHLKMENEISWNSYRFHLKKYIDEKRMDIDVNQICP